MNRKSSQLILLTLVTLLFASTSFSAGHEEKACKLLLINPNKSRTLRMRCYIKDINEPKGHENEFPLVLPTLSKQELYLPVTSQMLKCRKRLLLASKEKIEKAGWVLNIKLANCATNKTVLIYKLSIKGKGDDAIYKLHRIESKKLSTYESYSEKMLDETQNIQLKHYRPQKSKTAQHSTHKNYRLRTLAEARAGE